MPTDNDADRPILPLTSSDIDDYKTVAAGEALEAPERLLRLGLVVQSPYADGRPVALDPRDVQQKLLEARYKELATLAEQLRLLPQLETLRTAYEPEPRRGEPSSELLQTMTQMDTRIGEASSRATVECLSAQPIPRAKRDPKSLQTGLERSLALLRRGVTVRLLYGPAALNDPATREYVEEFIGEGGGVRIHRRPFIRTLIVDGSDLFIDDYRKSTPPPAAGCHITDRAVVAWARQVYTYLWESSYTWKESLAWDTEALSERQLKILGDMAAGYDQEVIAHRIGISPRQVTADLKEARTRLGMRSTYQLMAWYGRWMAGRSGGTGGR
ncbi:LuxR C-terminal-related transcriptional regulator [Streptomyces sp. NPDC012794]|uniref:LuxR C-terminal-related transcriptional regulator n=1 Tax=Streptomyces sp. NPDC012794 TaxID=3364850 RepID=UPI0036BEB643